MAKSLYTLCALVCEHAASGHIVMAVWTSALILLSLSTLWPTWLRTGLFSATGRYKRSAEGTAPGLHTNAQAHTHTFADACI